MRSLAAAVRQKYEHTHRHILCAVTVTVTVTVKLTDFLLRLNRIAYLLLRFRAVGQAKMPGLAERNWTQITYYMAT